jgi:hypothetical protein
MTAIKIIIAIHCIQISMNVGGMTPSVPAMVPMLSASTPMAAMSALVNKATETMTLSVKVRQKLMKYQFWGEHHNMPWVWDGFPLGLGLAVEDKPTEFSCIYFRCR